MDTLRLALAMSILLFADKYFNHSKVEAQQFPFEKPFIDLATGSIKNTILEKFSGLKPVENKPFCAFSIGNNLTSYRLLDPFVYLKHGEHPMPVPVRIETNSTAETFFQASGESKDTAGLLFYEIEKTAHILVIYWKISGPKTLQKFKKNRFNVRLIKTEKFCDLENSLEKLYNEIAGYSHDIENLMEKTISVHVPGEPARDAPEITIRAQITTEKHAKFAITLSDNLPSVTPSLHKRAIPTSIALGIARFVFGLAVDKV